MGLVGRAQRRGGLSGLIVFTMLIGTAACGAKKVYEGPAVPDAELATISPAYFECYWLLARCQVRIVRIDGTGISESSSDATLEVRPGLRKITFVYQEDSLCTVACLTKDQWLGEAILYAEAGHDYRVRVRRDGQRIWSWVEDKTTGLIVAGEPHPDAVG
ncbi:MAG: hypothetical protein QNJ94_08360 [Alphaproteobacteria bacterium]|nr:hypothetical protein [Alphaproteobacteria bacterium]